MSNPIFEAVKAIADRTASGQKVITEQATVALNTSGEYQPTEVQRARDLFTNALWLIDDTYGEDKNMKKVATDTLRMQLRRAALHLRKGTADEGVAASVKKLEGKYTFIVRVESTPKAVDVSKHLQVVLDHLTDESVREALYAALLAYESA